MNNHLTNDQQRLIDMYINQYNTTNSHIEHLLDMLDEIRSNLFNVITLNQPRRTRINRHSRNTNTNTNTNTNINQMFNDRQNSYIHYDYNTPINPNIYNENVNRTNVTNRNNINNRNNRTNVNNRNNINNRTNVNPNVSSSIFDSNEITNFFTNFLNTSVSIRPTQQQIESASRLIKYSEIEHPLSEICPILLERFSNEEMIRQLKPCGHLFCQSSFQQWFENNVRCPVCRYDIRNYRDTTTSPQHISETNQQSETNVEDVNENSDQQPQSQQPQQSQKPQQQPTNNFSINRNTLSNEIYNISFDIIVNNLANNLANRLFQSILSPQSATQNNNDTFMFDASNNMLFYETILRPHNRNQNNM